LSVKFIKGIDNYQTNADKSAVVTIGTFDGIHRGHQEILKRVVETGEHYNLEAVLVTFHPHPKVLVNPDHIPLLLTTLEEKRKFIPHFFQGNVLILDFDDNLKELSGEEFVREILIKIINAKKVIVGYDHAFGKNRSGNIDMLKNLGDKYDFEVEVIGPFMYQKQAISSSRIREAMLNNQYEDAIKMLGHDYAIYGKVERGIGLGRRLGYPTANVRYGLRKLLPREGVYACWAQIGNEDKEGMMFIGKNHFNPQECITVEANLFDFDRDIYGEEIFVYPTHYIRKNRKFKTIDQLVKQIELDKKNILEIIEKEKRNVNQQRAESSNYL